MVVKSKEESEHLTDLNETFAILRRHNVSLNASKCSFGVRSRKFLSYMITHRGIEVNPNQIRAIHNLHPPFFQLLHKWKDFSWSKYCDKAFEDLKAYLAHPPILSRPEKEEILYAYIAVTPHAVSLVLVRVEEGIQNQCIMSVNPSKRLKLGIFLLRRLSWLSFMPLKSFRTTSKLTQWSSLLNCLCRHYFGDPTILEEWQSEEPCWVDLISSICLTWP